MEFKSTAEQDRHYICEIGRLFWGNDKQCYAPDAVYRKVKSLLEKECSIQSKLKPACQLIDHDRYW